MIESIGGTITSHLDPQSAGIQQEVVWLTRAGASFCCIAASFATLQYSSLALWPAIIVSWSLVWFFAWAHATPNRTAVAVTVAVTVAGQYGAGLATDLFIYPKSSYSPIGLILNTIGLSLFWAAQRFDRYANNALFPSTFVIATKTSVAVQEEEQAPAGADQTEDDSIITTTNSHSHSPIAQPDHCRHNNPVVANELIDMARMILATLEHCTPNSNLLEKPGLLSTCSVSIPIASVLAITTVAEQVVYLGTHMDRFTSSHDSDVTPPHTQKKDEFNIGDLTQQVVDVLVGMADSLDVNLVLYHADNGLHYVDAIGDENAVRHALLTLLRNILKGCTPGACIEVRLKVGINDDDSNKVRVTWTATYCPSPAIPSHLSHIPHGMSTTATDRIMAYAGASLQITSPILLENNIDPVDNRTRYDVHLDLMSRRSSSCRRGRRGRRLMLEEVPFSSEPSLEDLTAFVHHLSGVRMVLHSRERSVFSKHLTSCLTSWSVDISHVPIGSSATENVVAPITVFQQQQQKEEEGLLPLLLLPPPPPPPPPPLPAFILIDDDIETLEYQLKQQLLQQQQHSSSIIYFTSLDNYKRMRDMLGTFVVLPLLLIVVPKPAGPRRFLTALHTAWHGAVVEPQFTPIAQYISAIPQWVAPGMVCERSGKVHHPPADDDGGDNRSGNVINDCFLPPHIPQQHDHHRQQGVVTMLPNTALAPVTPAETPQEGWRRKAQILGEQQQQVVVASASGGKEVGVAVTTTVVGKKADVSEAQETVGKPKATSALSMRRSISRRQKKPTSGKGALVSPPINVLIVEDNMINQTILVTWMKKRKIQCSVASNGQEAVERWETGGFHLVLMDIQLPVMDGIAATTTIRAIEKEKRKGVLPKDRSQADRFQSPVIIVALTASSLESDRHAAMAAGCNDFLTKPISLEWLEKKIVEWGCMQALIDFEGWRRWKRGVTTVEEETRQEVSAAAAVAASTVPSSSTPMTPPLRLQQQPQQVPASAVLLHNERRRTPQQPPPGHGVLMLGMATRRRPQSSSVDQFPTKVRPRKTMAMLAMGNSSVV